MTILKIECENIYEKEQSTDVVQISKKIFNYFMSLDEIVSKSCLAGYEYSSISFDFLLCNGDKTQEINKNYRQKDYPADIITFAVFADSPDGEKFVLDGDINLGEIIIALDKIEENANNKGIETDKELIFFIAHGILHLLGFDHQTEEDYNFVIDKQIKALESMDINYDKV